MISNRIREPKRCLTLREDRLADAGWRHVPLKPEEAKRERTLLLVTVSRKGLEGEFDSCRSRRWPPITLGL